MNWHDRFDRLLKAMAQGEPPKAGKNKTRPEKSAPPAKSPSRGDSN